MQDRLFDEITRTIGNKTEPVTYQQLTGLKYMEMVIKESFRLYPPVPLIGRHLENDVVLGNQTKYENFWINKIELFIFIFRRRSCITS